MIKWLAMATALRAEMGTGERRDALVTLQPSIRTTIPTPA